MSRHRTLPSCAAMAKDSLRCVPSFFRRSIRSTSWASCSRAWETVSNPASTPSYVPAIMMRRDGKVVEGIVMVGLVFVALCSLDVRLGSPVDF